MVLVWLGAIALFYLLPFQLEGTRIMTLYGFMILVLFIGVFCLGALAAALPQPQQLRPENLVVDFTLTDRVLIVACVVSVLASLMDIQGRNVLDLADAYQQRDGRAGALLAGAQSNSTVWFQIAFLTYPAAYVFTLREVVYRAKPVIWRIAAFGLAPVVLSSLAMGGRAPLLYAFIMLVYGFALRKQLFKPLARPEQAVAASGGSRGRVPFRLGGPAKAVVALIGSIVFLYFVQVFFVRADVAGGADAMFGVAGQYWGVNFNGRFSDVFFSLFGSNGTYLIFIFFWYLLQGFVISNAIFSDYEGSMLFGAYGVDIVGAMLRRINAEFIGSGYAELLQMNVYGFLPSAFGSLYVDFHFFGLLPCLLWGWLAGKVYGKVRQGRDPRWLMVVPFITVGIFFSLINSPIGFSNGFVTHIWLILAFMTARVRTRLQAPQCKPVVATR
jgi:hypothetical protein